MHQLKHVDEATGVVTQATGATKQEAITNFVKVSMGSVKGINPKDVKHTETKA